MQQALPIFDEVATSCYRLEASLVGGRKPACPSINAPNLIPGNAIRARRKDRTRRERTTNHEPRTTNHEPRAAAARSQSRGEVRHPARDGMRRAQRLLIGLPRFLPRCTTIPAAAATVPHEDLTTYAHPPRISSQSCAAPSTIHRFNRPPRAKLPAGLEASQILPQEKDRYKRLHVFNCWCFQTPA